MSWKTKPISRTCEAENGLCGKRTTHAYKAHGGGWGAICSEHVAVHAEYAIPVAQLLEEGETWKGEEWNDRGSQPLDVATLPEWVRKAVNVDPTVNAVLRGCRAMGMSQGEFFERLAHTLHGIVAEQRQRLIELPHVRAFAAEPWPHV